MVGRSIGCVLRRKSMMAPQYIGCLTGLIGLVLAFGIGNIASGNADTLSLSIEDAIDLALVSDPEIRSLRLHADAQDKLAEAAMQLPEPTVRTGISNVPLDSFALNREPMTQTLIGIRQTIPAIGSRSATSMNLERLSEASHYQAALQAKETTLAVRIAWLEAHYQRRAVALTSQASDLLGSLTDVVRARYAAGDELQLTVLAAELELNGMQSRLIDTERNEFQNLNELRRLLGATRSISIDRELPTWNAVPTKRSVNDALATHPRIQAADAVIAAAAAKVQLRETTLKPEWHIDLSYGARDGNDIGGESRSDFASATLSFSWPFLAKKQHTLRLDAAHTEEDAARLSKDKLLRDMAAEVALAYSEWDLLSESLRLLDDAIVTQTHNHAEAALKAYQNKEGSFEGVLLSYVKEVDAKLDQYRVTIDRLKAWAKIDSLNGLTK